MPPSIKPGSEPFPVRPVAEVEPLASDRLWLVEGLWLEQGVGVLGGAPKCCKTWIAADLAVAVATGGAALGRFPARQSGPVIFFGAEDSQPALRSRFEGIARTRGVALDEVPVLLLDVASLRLDRADHLARLDATVRAHRPRLLVLDPFVRLARIDENSAAEVSAVLGSLRDLQRAHELAILLVHHARKASGTSPSQAFRGSGDFAAWGDSNLHVARRGDELLLALEHRSAAPPDPLRLRLATLPAPHLTLVDAAASTPVPFAALEQQLLERLRHTARPLSTSELRDAVRRRKADVVAALEALSRAALVRRDRSGWRCAPPLDADAGPEKQRSLFPT